jgi:uncharacterized membrane protein
MVNLADTNRNGTVDGTASEWAIGTSYANEMSSDGSIIAGSGSDGTTRRAFRWDATNGMVNLADTDGNGTVDGTASEWAIGRSYANAMSSDGSVITGYGNDGTDDRAFIYKSSLSGGVMLDAANTQTSIVQNAAAQGAVVSSLTASLSNAVQAELEVDTGTQMLRRRGPSNPDKMPMAVSISAAQSSNKNASTVSVAGIKQQWGFQMS